jgi:dienelactone hydrolase
VEHQSGRRRGLFRQWGAWARRVWLAVAPGPTAWRGAAWGALTSLTVILLVTAFGMYGRAGPVRFLMGISFFLAVFALVGGLLTLVWRVLESIPVFYAWVLACALPVLALLAMTAISVQVGIVIVGLGTLAVASLLGAGVATLASGGWRRGTNVQRAVALAGLLLGLVGTIAGGGWLLDAGSPLIDLPNAAAQAGAQIDPLDLPDPSKPGPYTVRTLLYGSGEDRRRSEYGVKADLVTEPVDGSSLIERWSRLRTAHWGFGPDTLPLNGRVWYPEGEGVFPLVLIVHGQHPMEDASEPGYAYLGELLASRGFIVASVDENYLNLSPLVDLLIVQSLVEENDLRGLLLLEHLCAWRAWNADPDSVFYGKVDLDRIALIGHSRGGEAVAVATAFNELSYYPDDASVRFDYGFGIRSVVALAPVEGTYRPAGRGVALENVNYLVLHGAHDMDVFTFQGTRQYARVSFANGDDWFKSAVYIYGANHGQFNTRWGRKDLFEPIMRVFNLEQLMPGESQRQIAKTTISAFLEATLHGKTGYRALFQDLRRGQAWLPDTIYLYQYQDAATQMVSTCEEDIDLMSTTLPGGSLYAENLTIWREQPARAKWKDLGDQAVYLGWDVGAVPEMASYTIQIPAQALTLDEKNVLVFSMADANEDPTPGTEDEDERRSARNPIDLTVEVVDNAGEVSRLPLSHFMPLQPQLKGQVGKTAFMSLLPTSEAVLQHFEFSLADFVDANAAFNPASLVQVRFIFDRTEAGVVVLDSVGFRP